MRNLGLPFQSPVWALGSRTPVSRASCPLEPSAGRGLFVTAELGGGAAVLHRLAPLPRTFSAGDLGLGLPLSPPGVLIFSELTASPFSSESRSEFWTLGVEF